MLSCHGFIARTHVRAETTPRSETKNSS